MGYSGHAFIVIDTALDSGFEVKSYFDKAKSFLNPYGLVYQGYEKEIDLKAVLASDIVFPAVGSNNLRKEMIKLIEQHNLNQCFLVNPSSKVSSKAQLGTSVLVGPNAIINSLAIIGKGSIVNSGAIVEHECEVGPFSHIAPGSVLAGNVRVGSNVFVGANSTIKQGIHIGDNAIIGAGSVVIKDVPRGEIWVGNPAKKMKVNEE